MDGLKDDPLVVNVVELDEGVPGGMVCPLIFRQGRLDLLPVGLGGGQAVVAVAHGEEEHGVIAVLLFKSILVGELREGGEDVLHVPLPRHKTTGDMAAAQHQVGVVEAGKLLRLLHQGLDDGTLGVVDEDQDVGELHRGPLPDLQPGRDAGDDGPLGGADQGTGALGVVVFFEIKSHDQAVACIAVGGAFHQHEALGLLLQDALLQILLHVGLDGGDTLGLIRAAQIRFRQNEVQRGGGVTDDLPGFLPILLLGGELVAGHHGPLHHVRSLGREHHFRDENADRVAVLLIHDH